jgi:hypothetical protein
LVDINLGTDQDNIDDKHSHHKYSHEDSLEVVQLKLERFDNDDENKKGELETK